MATVILDPQQRVHVGVLSFDPTCRAHLGIICVVGTAVTKFPLKLKLARSDVTVSGAPGPSKIEVC